jgi:type I restriction enzyme M protein
MGLVFEELIRKFAEISNETAGEHFTPREVIRLMVNLLFIEDDDVLTPGNAVVRTIYDPTAGTGGMLSVAGEYLLEHNPDARLTMFGQELNDESYAICKADMLIKGQDVGNIVVGNTLSEDGHSGRKFDYMLSNPPFGVEWKKVEKEVRKEATEKGLRRPLRPRPAARLRWLDALPAAPHQQDAPGCRWRQPHRHRSQRLAPVYRRRRQRRKRNPPLRAGNDLVEAIIGLPTDMFYNTGISTYVWILSNKKPPTAKAGCSSSTPAASGRRCARAWAASARSCPTQHIADITRLFGEFAEAEQATVLDAAGKEISRNLQLTGATRPTAPTGGKVKVVPISRIFKNEEFGYTTLTVERPLRDAAGKVILGEKGKQKGKPQADSALRDTENVPLTDDIAAYFQREVLPHAPDAWIDHEKSKVGYEIPFNRHFYVFEPPRSLHEIDEELKGVTANIMRMLEGLAE